MSKQQTALIIGAGPAGLTAALELIRHSNIKPVVFEASGEIGGISRTVNHNGNRMDIGGHRFFSKSDWVMKWWQEILPIDASASAGGKVDISYQNKQRAVDVAAAPAADSEKRMLLRPRLSRIYFLRKFFDYPLKVNLTTITNLGAVRIVTVGMSYIHARLFPRKPERSLEDFIVNRFGKQLYLTFFKDYTEKVWGVPCTEISPEWGAQRIKGLSITTALKHALKKLWSRGEGKAVQTSLIERFLYPQLGPGQLWEEVAAQVIAGGGEIVRHHSACGIQLDGGKVSSLTVKDMRSGVEQTLQGDYVFSTMPVKDLVAAMGAAAPGEVRRVAGALPYRDFITVGLLLKEMMPNSQTRSEHANNMPPDNWIYIQEKDVKVGRLQIFNNWSPNLVKVPGHIWLGLEYFCQEGDALWTLSEDEMIKLAIRELIQLGMLDNASLVSDQVVIKVPKAYPAYFGAYDEFGTIREFVDGIENLFLIGRNGMHKYNNQDHSMLTAKLAVENVIEGRRDKANLWAINVDDEYHEEVYQDAGKQGANAAVEAPALAKAAH